MAVRLKEYRHLLIYFLQCIKKANEFHPTIKLTAEVSDSETTFLDITFYKGKPSYETDILDVSKHFKLTEKKPKVQEEILPSVTEF